MAKHVQGEGNKALIYSATVTDTTVQTTDPQQIYDFDSVGLQLVTTGPLRGSFTVEISSNYVPASSVPVDGEVPHATVRWSPATAMFTPTIAAVATDGSTQAVKAELPFRHFRVKFTPTAGSGTVEIYAFAKSWS